MQFTRQPERHLTYCTNIHPGEEWGPVFEQIRNHVPELKKRLSPDQPFGIGLRLSALAAEELLKDDNLSHFKTWLDEHELYVFTMNGFPYGSFHGTQVKDDVYKPDWTTKERVDYTLNLANILAELLPDGMEGGISTSPLSYKYWSNGDENARQQQVFQQSTHHLALVAQRLAEIRESSGKLIHLDIEPEPDCTLENSRETVDFFTKWLFSKGSEYMANQFDVSPDRARQILQTHIGICYDTCHFAVEYENPGEAIRAIKAAGIRIGKTQISAALKARFDSDAQKKNLLNRLQQFEEDTYLHQVVERDSNGQLHQYRDLPDAFTAVHSNAREWRIHYHVPVFINEYEGLHSTRDDITTSLEVLLNETDCAHFEIETYTWHVLPDHLKVNITDSIEREFNWVLDGLKPHSITRK